MSFCRKSKITNKFFILTLNVKALNIKLELAELNLKLKRQTKKIESELSLLNKDNKDLTEKIKHLNKEIEFKEVKEKEALKQRNLQEMELMNLKLVIIYYMKK